jgi:hypothetical protein
MTRWMILFGVAMAAQGHDIITTAITFDREISRILYTHCVACHHEGGSAFSLMTYGEVRPWAVAIKEEILTRRMPPWGAIKGFGEFRNDEGLTPEQFELVTSWTDGGVPEGNDKDLPPAPKFDKPAAPDHVHGDIVVSGDYKLPRAFLLDGLLPRTVPDHASMQIMAELPDGNVEPLLWLENYRPQFAHAFLRRKPLPLPAGTVIRGIPAGVKISLLPWEAPPPKAEQAQSK